MSFYLGDLLLMMKIYYNSYLMDYQIYLVDYYLNINNSNIKI